MKWIKLYESYRDIDSICEKYGIYNYTINKDNTIDVDGVVNLSYKELTKLPLKFGKVSGDFYCNNNNLTTLEGGPQSVGRSFNCRNNYLNTLEGCPKSVGGSFNCSENELTTLEGGPQSVGENFYLEENELKDLYGFPEFFDNTIYYYNNPIEEILDLFNINKLGKVIDFLNEYGVIQQNGKLVVLDRLEEVFHLLIIEIPEEINLHNYEVN